MKTQIARIFVQKEKCNGCRICELRCSFEHEQVFSPTLSRIFIHKNELEGVAIPKTCVICGKCLESCPESAIVKSPKTGAIEIISEKCIACEVCVNVCPHGVIHIHPMKNIAFTCDLCNGAPQCVKYCPENALHYMSLAEFREFKTEEKQRTQTRVSSIP